MRNPYYFIAFFFLLLTSGGGVKGQGFSWAQSFSPGTVGGMAVNANNDIYLMGGFNTIIDVDRGAGVHNITPIGQNNIFLVKENTAGHFQWAKQFQCKSAGNQGFIGTVGISVEPSGSIYISGAFRDTIDFDPGPATFYLTALTSHPHVYIVKLDSSGNFIWAKDVGGGINSAVGWRDLKVNRQNVFLAAAFGGTIDVDPNAGIVNLTPIGAQAAMLIEKLDSAGNYVWAKQLNDAGALGLALDTISNLYITGTLQNTIDCDPGPNVFNLTSSGSDDVLIEKLDSAGNFQWAKRIGGSGSDLAQGIAVDNFGNIVVTGYYAAGTVDFDPGPGSYDITASSRDMFILRLRNNGDFSWAVSVHPPGNDDGRAITTDGRGNIYTTGEFFSSADFDPGPGTHMLSAGVYVQKLDSTGNFVWARAWEADIPGWIMLDHNNSVYTTGSFSGSNKDFDPGPGSYFLSGINGSGFIHKMTQPPLSIADNPSLPVGLNVFPNPSSGIMTLTSSSVIDQIEITDIAGKIIYSNDPDRTNLAIDLSGKASGVYFYSVTVGERKVRGKILLAF